MAEIKRKYPCQAKIDGSKICKIPGEEEIEVTVLTENRSHECGAVGHKVEFPEGFPEPPSNCPTWIVSSDYLIFEK